MMDQPIKNMLIQVLRNQLLNMESIKTSMGKQMYLPPHYKEYDLHIKQTVSLLNSIDLENDI